MHRNPARQSNSHRTNLATIHPDTSCAGITLAHDAEICQRLDDHAFEHPQISIYSQTKSIEIQDQIDDKLTRPVPRHITTAISLHAFHATMRQLLLRKQNIFLCIDSSRNGHDSWMMLKKINLTSTKLRRKSSAHLRSRRNDSLVSFFLNRISPRIGECAKVDEVHQIRAICAIFLAGQFTSNLGGGIHHRRS